MIKLSRLLCVILTSGLLMAAVSQAALTPGGTGSPSAKLFGVDDTTHVSGVISGTVIWDAAHSPYIVDSTITVPSGDTLIIQPGVRVVFLPAPLTALPYRLQVQGLLQAVGTEQDSIVFTATSSTVGWGGIRFVNAHVNSRLEYCRLELGWAKGAFPDGCGGAVYLFGGIQSIKHCSFINNSAWLDGGAVYLWGGSPEFAYNLFTKNIAATDPDITHHPVDGAHGHALYMGNCTGLVLNSVTIAYNNNGSSVGYSLYVETYDKLVMRNSILWDTHRLWLLLPQSGLLFDPNGIQYSDITGVPSDTLQVMGEGNIGSKGDENPHFINLPAGNLRVKNYSKTIDGASPTAPYDGEPMPNGGRANMGAYGNDSLAAPSIPLISFDRDSLDVHFHPDTILSHTDLVEFGLQKINTTGRQTVLMYNIGRANLNIDSLGLTDPQFTSNFDSLADPGTGSIVVPSYDSVFVGLLLTPTAIANINGTWTTYSNDTSYHTLLNLHGTGVNPVMVVSVDTMEFGLVSRGDSLDLPFKVWNDGQNQGSIHSKLVIRTGPFSYPTSSSFFPVDLTPYLPANPWYIVDTLEVHDTAHYVMRFKPFGEVDYQSFVNILSNAGNDSIYCFGSGSSAIYHFDTDTLLFGVVPLDTQKTMYVHFWNTGSLPLGLDSLVIIGLDSLNFTAIDTLSFAIPTNDTAAIPVIFHPLGAGPRNAQLMVYTDIPGSAPWSVRLLGTGTSQINWWIGEVGDTTWTKEHQPYYVVGDITIPTNHTLTIQDSVQVLCEGNFSITVNGSLQANGDSAAPIVFSTITADSTWNGLRFEQGSSGSVLRYVNMTRGFATLDSLGGVLSVTDASPLFEHCQFFGNSTNIARIDTNVVPHDTIITPFGKGGAAFVHGNSAPIFKYCEFRNNQSKEGGGFYADWLTRPILDSCNFHDNNATLGGGISIAGSVGTILNCLIHNNMAAQSGGGLYLSSGAVTEVHDNLIYNNTASDGGGVAVIFFTRPFIHDEVIYGNAATGKGGGMFINDNSSPIVTRTLIAENTAVHSKALYSQGSAPIINYCTLVGVPDTVAGWVLGSGSGDGALVTNSIIGSANWNSNAYGAVAKLSSNMMITYCDLVDTLGGIFPALGDTSVNPAFVGVGATPQARYDLQPGSPALALSEPDANGERGPIGFNHGSIVIPWTITLSMLQNPVALGYLNFILTSTVPLMAPPYLRLEQDLPNDTLGYAPQDSNFMDADGPGVYIQPFTVTSLFAPSRLTITFEDIFGADTTLQQTFIAANLSGTLSTMNLGGDVIIYGRAAAGSGIWAVMPEIYSSLKPLGNQLQSVGQAYQVLTSAPELADGRIEFALNNNLLVGRSAAHCAVARWVENAWHVIPSNLSGDLTTLSAAITTAGTYRVVWGQNLNTAILPSQIELAQNYPNPFNPETTIRFNLPKDGQVKLEVFDIQGRKVITLLDGQRIAGLNQVIWSGVNAEGITVSSGMYFYRLQTGQKQITKKMVLLR